MAAKESDCNVSESDRVDSGVGFSEADSISDDQLYSEVAFREAVLAANEEFREKMIGYINWFRSDVNKRIWPVRYAKSKNSYRQQLKKYEFDEGSGVLWKISQGKEGVPGM